MSDQSNNDQTDWEFFTQNDSDLRDHRISLLSKESRSKLTPPSLGEYWAGLTGKPSGTETKPTKAEPIGRSASCFAISLEIWLRWTGCSVRVGVIARSGTRGEED